MSKLDEQGILTLSAIQNVLDSCVGNGFTMESYYLAVASAERDALLELFESWIDEKLAALRENSKKKGAI